jgi:hypothetical protein
MAHQALGFVGRFPWGLGEAHGAGKKNSRGQRHLESNRLSH